MNTNVAAALAVALVSSVSACAGVSTQNSEERVAQAVIDEHRAPCGKVVNSANFRGALPAANLMALCSNGTKYVLLRTPAMGWDLGVYDQRTDTVRPFKL